MDRTKITFAQAEGIIALPTQLKPKELSKPLRNALWNAIYNSFSQACGFDYQAGRNSIRAPWLNIFFTWHTDWLHEPADEFSDNPNLWGDHLKKRFLAGKYHEVFEFLQYILRSRAKPNQLEHQISQILDAHGAAYAIVGNPLTIMPISSKEEALAINTALKDIQDDKFSGAQKHMANAAAALTNGKFADSIRESISAVESVCKVLGEKPDADLESALNALTKSKPIHPALRLGLSKLYAYTSNEKGIRHALLENEANVDAADAMFMFGACASFISYLVKKSK